LKRRIVMKRQFVITTCLLSLLLAVVLSASFASAATEFIQKSEISSVKSDSSSINSMASSNGSYTIYCDGGFEDWSTTDPSEPRWLTHTEVDNNVINEIDLLAHSGDWFAAFSSSSKYTKTENSWVEREIEIPKGDALLSFYFRIENNEVSGVFNVKIDGKVLHTINNTDTNYGEYKKVPVDINEFADGNKHNLRFEASIEPAASLKSTDFFLDDIEVTITPPPSGELKLTVPNGGEVWCMGERYTIEWESSNVEGNVKIDLICDDCESLTQTTLVSETENDGAYIWRVPTTLEPSKQYKIKITSIDDASIYDESDDYFEIKDCGGQCEGTITSPQAGAIWLYNFNYYIQWDSNQFGDDYVSIEVISGGKTTVIASQAANNGTYRWKVNASPSDNCKIVIKSSSLQCESGIFSIMRLSDIFPPWR
jgi:hypothetical protein